MNFMANDSSQGFYGEEDRYNQNHHNQNQMSNNTNGIGKLPFSSNSSSSSASQPHKNLVPLTFHHRHQQQQNYHQRGSGSWFENINFEPRRPISAADEISSSGIRCYSRTGGGERGGAASNLDLMDASPSVARNNISEEEDDDVMMRRADSSSGGGGGGGGGGERGGSASASGHVEVEREHMFDKVVTPSDVGKLNRLVIPKQHAEKFFPLDSSTNDKGLLLNFEDRNGKPWRFRYSYWNSSQSYVMTKGWSRFVKEKKLDAGDIVSFQRGLGDLGKDRLFIDWRRRPQLVPGQVLPPISSLSHLSPQHYLSFHRSTQPSSAAAAAWSSAASTPLFFQPQAASRDYSSHFHQFQQHQQHQYPTNASNYNQPSHSTGSYHGYGYGTSSGPYGYNSNSTHHPYSSSVVYLRSAAAAHVSPQQVQAAGLVQLQSGGGDIGGVEPVVPMVFESVPVVQGKAAAKRLRLFGVNMDCPISESDHECDVILSSTAVDATVPYAAAAATTRPPYLSSSSSPLQLRLYNGSPVLSPVHPPDKGNSSSYKSFDLDI